MNMLNKFKIVTLTILAMSGLLFAALPATTFALDCNNAATITSSKDAIQCGTNNVSGNTDNPNKAVTSVNHTITVVINILSVVVGIIATIMVVIGGFRYATSAGDSSKVQAAKNTILYAIIGLIIVALSQVLVRFVLNKATTVTPACVSGHIDSGPHAGDACTP